MASRLESLVPAGRYFLLSRQERSLLRFALDRFGVPLSRFLLSGLGEEDEASLWLFTITFTDQSGVMRRREIKVEAEDYPDEPRLLPRRREPLVMLALLRLFMEDRVRSSSGLWYGQEQVLNLLGRDNTAESCASIDEAVKRYARLSYGWGLGRDELAEKRLSFYEAEARFITGYGSYDEEEGGELRRAARRVDFASEFVDELARRTLFGIDWNAVSDTSRHTP
jgi:hypothetical protein